MKFMNLKDLEFKINEETFNNDPQRIVLEIVAAIERALNGEDFIMSEEVAEKHLYECK